MDEKSTASLTLLDVVRQWPVASNIAEHLPAGSLINLARSSSSLREVLHAFSFSTPLDAQLTSDGGAPAGLDNVRQRVGSRNVLRIGDHRTPYWEGLKRVAPFNCSSKTHTKGENTRSCLYCSMPICESCIVKHSFGKNEGTFKNRCRFMCQRCWDTGNLQKERRYSGVLSGAGKCTHKSAGHARNFCVCTSKDGWVCNDCKERQNTDAKANGWKFCSGDQCGAVLEEDKERRKICLWCDKPVPRVRASMESKIAFDQKMMDARERELGSQMGDLQEYESNRRKQMRMSRREMRGDDAVKDDPDADVPQFLRNLDTLNYKNYCGKQPTGDEIYRSQHGQWRYNRDFLMCFRRRCSRQWESTSLKHLTSYETQDGSTLKTNIAVWMPKWRRQRFGEFGECFGDASVASPQPVWHETENLGQMVEQKELAAKANPGQSKVPTEWEEAQELDDNDDILISRDDEISEACRETPPHADTDPENSGSGRELVEIQPGERPPEYGADTLILET